MQQKFDIKGLEHKFKRLISTLPLLAGNEAVNFFKSTFRDQAWTDHTTQPWKIRKKNKDAGRAILVKSGRLRRSIRIVSVTSDSVTIGTDVPYAKVHNEGSNETVSVKAHTRKKNESQKIYSTEVFNVKSRKGKSRTLKVQVGEIAVKAHTKKMRMPKRQFMGDSAVLRRNIERMIKYEINKIVKT